MNISSAFLLKADDKHVVVFCSFAGLVCPICLYLYCKYVSSLQKYSGFLLYV